MEESEDECGSVRSMVRMWMWMLIYVLKNNIRIKKNPVEIFKRHRRIDPEKISGGNPQFKCCKAFSF